MQLLCKIVVLNGLIIHRKMISFDTWCIVVTQQEILHWEYCNSGGFGVEFACSPPFPQKCVIKKSKLIADTGVVLHNGRMDGSGLGECVGRWMDTYSEENWRFVCLFFDGFIST